jgi:heme exporter protein A
MMGLQVSQLACARGDRQLFFDVSFELRRGEALWLQGRNGSGKTSLLRLLCGLGVPLAGEIRWHGRPIRQLREDYHRELLYCGHAGAIKDELSAWENVATASALAGRPCTPAQAQQALARLGLAALAQQPARLLSQGQRRRVALAQLALPALPPLLLLDEPFVALDESATRALCGTLEGHLARGGLLVYTTHQPQALAAPRHTALDLDHRQLLPC